MKILYVVHQFYPKFISGTEQYVLSLAKAGRREGHDVRIFTVDPDFRDTSRPGQTDRYEVEGVPVTCYRLDKERVRNPVASDYVHPEVGPSFRDVLSEFQPEVVHFFHLRWLGVDRLEEAKARGAKAVFHLMDFWSVCPLFILVDRSGELCAGPGHPGWKCKDCLGYDPIMEAYSSPERKTVEEALEKVMKPGDTYSPFDQSLALLGRKPAIRKALESMDMVISPSMTARNVLVANGIYPRRLRIIPYGVDYGLLDSVSPPPPPPPVNIGYIGTFVPHKGVHVLLEAFTSFENENARLLLYGRFGDFPDYDGRLKRISNGDERISFPGPFRRKDLPRVLSGIHILVVPSLWRENTPFVVLEARAAGIYIIASDIPGISEVRFPGRLRLFSKGDSRELAEILEEKSRELLYEKGTGGGKDRESPSIERNFETLLLAYEDIPFD